MKRNNEKKTTTAPHGLHFPRLLSPESGPYSTISWDHRTAEITDDKGNKIFSLENVEVPDFWSQLATNVVASKYFRRAGSSGEQETSVRQIIDRVVDTITAWGEEQGYFAASEDIVVFSDELKWIIVNQMATFNSPVWFNVGIDENPFIAACFLNSVEDSMESIMELATTEAMLFKGGSGSGTNLSTLRSSKEKLSSGGVASGPVSFMRGYDAFAGVIKSAGKCRRAACMRILNADHPDILEFIDCKVGEEQKAWALLDAGYDGGLDGEAYSTVAFQNANNSVRVTDEFMRAVVNDDEYCTKAIQTGDSIETLKARDVLKRIAEAAHICGDPGLQFDDAINRWNTCSNSGWISASNPCIEFCFLDDSACNLASLNLMKFVNDAGHFDTATFRHVVDIMLTAQDIMVDKGHYPTEKIRRNSSAFRPMGLGFANLGALLMSLGLPYDSEKGRALAAGITALMTGEAYSHSGRMAMQMGAFEEYGRNAGPMRSVINQHADGLNSVDWGEVPEELGKAAKMAWTEAIVKGRHHGFRNAQVSALAPNGTTSFMMDCDSTGIEPDLSLVKTKQLSGGGSFRIVNQSVEKALQRLGYDDNDRRTIIDHINKTGAAVSAEALREEHLAVFDCALGERAISPAGHLAMMSAVQPFISGAISKTVNVANDITADEIFDIYVDAWKMGLKSITVYRDGSKRTQPLNVGSEKKREMVVSAPDRRRLPDERASLTHKFDIAGHKGYITAGQYADGSLGEIFITMSKQGSVVSGMMDSFAAAISIALQYGVPLEVFVRKYMHTHFEPSGVTRNPEIPIAKSIMDYLFRWLESRFGAGGGDEEQAQGGFSAVDSGMPPCPNCGSLMVPAGACHRCLNCGGSSGCG